VHSGFWWGYLREEDHLDETGVDGRIILKWIRSEERRVGKECGILWRSRGGAVR
jgi:hypothetical protein